MKNIRRLQSKNLKVVKTEKKEVKIRLPKNHIRIGNKSDDHFVSYDYMYATRVWCGAPTIPRGDLVSDESVFLSLLRRESKVRAAMGTVDCSCCLNMIQRSIRQRILGI